ncbi:hypothetical protein [Streptomyces sp. NPDC091209]|uniref:hypothetical protein n=1 Tax=Streptomyces sp. NPDC091209 TaxID=3365974 RepID=UPI0038213981
MSRRETADLVGSTGLGAMTAFGLLAGTVIENAGEPLWLDDSFLSSSMGHRPAVALALAHGLTATGTGAFPYMLAVLAGFLAARTARSRLVTIALSLAVLSAGQAARYGVMELVHRPRPPHEN